MTTTKDKKNYSRLVKPQFSSHDVRRTSDASAGFLQHFYYYIQLQDNLAKFSLFNLCRSCEWIGSNSVGGSDVHCASTIHLPVQLLLYYLRLMHVRGVRRGSGFLVIMLVALVSIRSTFRNHRNFYVISSNLVLKLLLLNKPVVDSVCLNYSSIQLIFYLLWNCAKILLQNNQRISKCKSLYEDRAVYEKKIFKGH